MKLILLSDSHGRLGNICKMLEATTADVYLHAGDHASDSEYIKQETGKTVHAVNGNCDQPFLYPTETLLHLAGHTILLVHGHLLGVKNNTQNLLERANSLGADIAVYGHTHIAEIATLNNILVLNPGSISLPKGSTHPTYIELDIGGNTPQAVIKFL